MNILEEIQRRYPHEPTKKIAQDLGLTLSQVYNRAHDMGLKKSDEYNNTLDSGRFPKGIRRSPATEFKKGVTPHNKGKQMPSQVYEKVSHTFFKKGHKPVNTKQNLDISIRRDKSGAEYKYIKLSDSHWELYHRYLWKQHNGSIPKGHIVVFKDKNSMNCTIENLEIITYKENMDRNTIQRYPAPLRQVMKLTNKLIKKINGKEQNK